MAARRSRQCQRHIYHGIGHQPLPGRHQLYSFFGTATTYPTLFTNANTTLNAASTITYLSSNSQAVSGTPTSGYGNLTFAPSTGTPTYTLGAATVVNGNLTIAQGRHWRMAGIALQWPAAIGSTTAGHSPRRAPTEFHLPAPPPTSISTALLARNHSAIFPLPSLRNR